MRKNIHLDFPKPLVKGNEVEIVASSSVIDSNESLLDGLKVFQEWGLICRSNDIIGRSYGYLAGSDEVRGKELHPKDKPHLMAFARGGWGSARLLEQSHIWTNGWMVGYSDVCSILMAKFKMGLGGGVHGPLVTQLAKEPEWSKQRLKSILFGNSIPDLRGNSWSRGSAKGPIVAGNLTVMTHLIGTKYMPNLKGSILVLEDIGEEPYKIDRMLTQWRLAGILQKVEGLAFGAFTNCHEDKNISNENTFSLEEVLKERCLDLNIPIISDLPIGHISGNASLPIGREAILDANKGVLRLTL